MSEKKARRAEGLISDVESTPEDVIRRYLAPGASNPKVDLEWSTCVLIRGRVLRVEGVVSLVVPASCLSDKEVG